MVHCIGKRIHHIFIIPILLCCNNTFLVGFYFVHDWLNLSTCLFIKLKLIVPCKNSKTVETNSSIFWIFIKNGQNNSCKVGFEPTPSISCMRSCPLGQRSIMSVGFCTVLMLHCQTSTSTVHADSSNLNEEMKLLFIELYIV